MSLEVHPHEPGGKLADFMNVVDTVFAGDPAFVRPLDFDLGGRLTPKKNPLFDHAEAMYFTARRDGRLVGRVSASVDHDFCATHGEGWGHFGFFDTID
ncbi:MAG: hypothetical protein H6719_32785, partial [Sandaracinaceae bacterium]|nr:hypothetical protein [Sandaracinaceae bacterium]